MTLYTNKTNEGNVTRPSCDDSTISTKGTLKGTTSTTKSKTGTAFVTFSSTDVSINDDTHGFMFSTFGDNQLSGYDNIPDTWILLDSQSTVNLFCNAALLTDIHSVATKLTVRSNGGCSHTNLMGTLNGFGDVWFDPHGIANIISMSDAEAKGFDQTKAEYSVIHGG